MHDRCSTSQSSQTLSTPRYSTALAFEHCLQLVSYYLHVNVTIKYKGLILKMSSLFNFGFKRQRDRLPSPPSNSLVLQLPILSLSTETFPLNMQPAVVELTTEVKLSNSETDNGNSATQSIPLEGLMNIGLVVDLTQGQRLKLSDADWLRFISNPWSAPEDFPVVLRLSMLIIFC